MDKMNVTRSSDDTKSKDSDLDFYLKSGLPSNQIISVLKSQGKDQKEIDAFVDKYETSRKKIAKVIKKFISKIEAKYGQLDVPELVKKGLSFASKYNFSQAEKDAFINLVMKDDVNTPYLPYDELGYTEMSKFLGFTNLSTPMFSIKAVDHPALNEIARLYDMSKPIHAAIRNNFMVYKNYSPETFSAKFDRSRDNVSVFIHPVIVALFLVKIPYLEQRCLFTNFGRLTVQRTQHYFQSQADKKYRLAGSNMFYNDTLQNELQGDLELTYDMARDPNSLNYISDESPMTNLLKRFSVQIELWKNVLSLRQGKFYSRSDIFSSDDGITGLLKVLSTYEWTYFDSPDMSQVHDEGTILRKILAVFSIRPTLTQISSYVNRSGIGFSNIGSVSKSTFIFTPICNIKLPSTITGRSRLVVDLKTALTQSDWFIENKMLVPKNKSVIQSKNVLFFYVNRRFQSPLTSVNMTFNYVAIPTNMSNLTSINTTAVNFTEHMKLGADNFTLRSVVTVNPLFNKTVSTGCSALMVMPPSRFDGFTSSKYVIYNPIMTGNMYKDPVSGKYMSRSVLNFIRPDTPNGFHELSKVYGTIFIYSLTV